MVRRYSKDITYEDCKRFKAEHPNLTRMAVKNHHTIYANAMERLGCLDELYPAVTYPKLTYEDCLRFKEEHPGMKRRIMGMVLLIHLTELFGGIMFVSTYNRTHK